MFFVRSRNVLGNTRTPQQAAIFRRLNQDRIKNQDQESKPSDVNGGAGNPLVDKGELRYHQADLEVNGRAGSQPTPRGKPNDNAGHP